MSDVDEETIKICVLINTIANSFIAGMCYPKWNDGGVFIACAIITTTIVIFSILCISITE